MANLTLGTLNLKCGNCGGKEFISPADPKPEDKVTCSACGGIFQLDELLTHAREDAGKAADAIGDALRKMFK